MRSAKYKITSPIRFFTFIFITVFITVFGLYSAFTFNSIEASSFNTLKQVTVQPNDTLWTIADIYCDDSDDVRDFIDDIMEVNELDSAEINVGDTILVPLG